MHILALYVIIASLLSPCIAYVFYVVYVPALPALHNSVAIATIQHQTISKLVEGRPHTNYYLYLVTSRQDLDAEVTFAGVYSQCVNSW
jgi:hypothetical protein